MNAHKTIRDLTQIAAMTAVLEVSKHALDALPNIELVSFLILMYTLYFGVKKTLAVIYIYDLVETLIFGMGTWVAAYLYVWDLLVLVTWLMRKNDSAWVFACISAVFGLAFGALCALVTLVIGGPSMAFAWWAAGIPYDIVHCIGNFTVCLLLYRPLSQVLKRLHKIYA